MPAPLTPTRVHYDDLELLLSMGLYPVKEHDTPQAIIVLSDIENMVPTYVGTLVDIGHLVVLVRLSPYAAGCYGEDENILVLGSPPSLPYFSDDKWDELYAEVLKPLDKEHFDHIVCAGTWPIHEDKITPVVQTWSAALREHRAAQLTFEILRAPYTSWQDALRHCASKLPSLTIHKLNGVNVESHVDAGYILGSLAKASQARLEYAALFPEGYDAECQYLEGLAHAMSNTTWNNDPSAFASTDPLFASVMGELERASESGQIDDTTGN